jgi:hypothetical protein
VLRLRGEQDIPWTPSPIPQGLELVGDLSAARWVEESLSKWPWATVGSLLPEAFDAYARILHPAYLEKDPGRPEPVRWATVASWTGRTVHPLMQFARIAGLSDDPDDQPPWGTRPHEGALQGTDELARLLQGFTSTPNRCWFCLWDGFGGSTWSPACAMPRALTLPAARTSSLAVLWMG